MSETSSAQIPPQPSGPAPGIMDAVRMGWRLLAADFWQVWLAALVVVAILAGIKMIPCISCLAPVIRIFIWPTLMAGLFWVMRSRIDGAPVEVGQLFGAFQRCYGQSLVAGLPITLMGLVVGTITFVVQFSMGMAFGFLRGSTGHEPDPGAIVMLYGLDFACVLVQEMIMGVVGLFFMFALLAIWETPEDGWGAAKRSARLVWSNLGAALGFGLVFAGLWIVGVLGVLACCVGYFFTMAVFQAWHAASVVYLYRSWTGQPLVQTFPAAAPPDAPALPEGALPPGM